MLLLACREELISAPKVIAFDHVYHYEIKHFLLNQIQYHILSSCTYQYQNLTQLTLLIVSPI